MITKQNYYKTIEEVGLKNLSKDMQEMHELINELTKSGSDWSAYDSDKELQQYCKVQFDQLEKAAGEKGLKNELAKKQKAFFIPGQIFFKGTKDEIEILNVFHEKNGVFYDVKSNDFGIDNLSEATIKSIISDIDVERKKTPASKKRNPASRRKGHLKTTTRNKNNKSKPVVKKQPKAKAAKFSIGDVICWWDNDGTGIREKITDISPDSKGVNIYTVKTSKDSWKYDEPYLINAIRRKEMAINKMPPKFEEAIPKEITFIRKYLRLNGNTVAKTDIIKFIKSIQLAITKREIRKTSDWAGEIMQIQTNLVKAHNKMIDDKASDIRISISPESIDMLQTAANSIAVDRHVVLIKRFLSWLSNTDKDKARKLLSDIEKEKFSGKAAADLVTVKAALESFVKDQPMKLSQMTLNGLCESCGVNGLGFVSQALATAAGIFVGRQADRYYTEKRAAKKDEQDPQQENESTVMNSADVAGADFKIIPFEGKWKNLIGQPSPGFSCLMFGPPKSGKSTLAIEFSKYLAANFGKVLYVAAEEGLNHTLSDKIQRLKAIDKNLSFSAELPHNLSQFKFVFIDSINRAKLDHDALIQLMNSHPGISFIFISQVTKDGAYRGSRELEHDVDCVIEVDATGHAKGYGRFAQGGEVEVNFG